jgi:hypothetical protein
MALCAGVAAASLLLSVPTSGAQEAGGLARQIAEAPDGSVRFSYAVREGVCGDGHHISIGFREDESEADWDCQPGPAWVEIEKSGPRVEHLDWWVGREPGSNETARTDLGVVLPAEAADYLVSLSRRANGELADEALGAAAVAADAEIWPELVEMVHDDALDPETREAAIFWLAELAGERATEDLETVVRSDDDLQVKEAALFGLSRLPDGSGVDAMIQVVRENEDPELVQASVFWLGQTGDPRAISLFQEILAQD